MIGPAISNQDILELITSSCDKNPLKEEELKDFKLDVMDINRVYYKEFSYMECKVFNLLCRIKYNNERIFAKRFVRTEGSGFHEKSEGDIFVTGDLNLFKEMMYQPSSQQMQEIDKAIRQNGY